jgi:cytochrome c-type biogenesis protein CcmH
MKRPVLITVGLLLLAVVGLLLASPAYAQDGGKKKVTDDEVNAVANKLYCPVCEGVSLDTCGTQACAQWRDEIRIQLESGQSPQQVVDNFVARYGDRVVGTPQNPTLRALSLVTPWVISAVALVVAVITFARWRINQARNPEPIPSAPARASSSADVYRARLERDLARRR